MIRNKVKEEELEFLAKEYKKYPQLFKKEIFLDSPEFLEKFGIFIEKKESSPRGYIKFFPQDFIVEETSKGGERQTIEVNSFLKEPSTPKEGLTTYGTLVKCGLSTIEAAEELSQILNLTRDKIQFAGIKDKDAITSQEISLRSTDIKALQKIDSPYFFLKNVYSGKGVVEIGSLKGNEFTVLVRTDPAFSEDPRRSRDNSFQKKEFLENLEKIKKEGFYNFFYLQRFGTPRLINFYWGLFILKGDYKKAVLSFLCSPGLRESLYFQELRKNIKNNWPDFQIIKKFLGPFPLIFQNEIKVINYLKAHPEDFIGGLNQIPEQVQLWVFAYASLIFNKKLSLFIKEKVEPAQVMPLILNKDKNDWLFYEEFLKKDGIFSLPLKNLKPFPYIQWRKRQIKTKEKAEIHKVKVIEEGVILNFTLPKAAYATTFLAHLFNLTSGLPPKDISPFSVDTKATLGEKSLEDVLNKFKDVIHSKAEDILEKYS